MGNKNSGRRPLPTSLKVLRGNPGQRKLNDLEPIPLDGPVEKPEGLSEAASVTWDRMAPVCIAMRTLTPGDVDAFATLCELQADMDMARRQKDEPGFAPFTLGQDFDGVPKVGIHGAIALELKLAPIIRAYYGLFGMDPSSRSKIHVPKEPDQPQSKWAGVLK